MTAHVLWFLAGCAFMLGLRLLVRLTRQRARGIAVGSQRRYEWAKEGEL